MTHPPAAATGRSRSRRLLRIAAIVLLLLAVVWAGGVAFLWLVWPT